MTYKLNGVPARLSNGVLKVNGKVVAVGVTEYPGLEFIPDPAPKPAPEPAYWEKRRELYRERLAEYKGVPEASQTDMIGFVLDAMLRAQSGDATELADMVGIINGVKAEVPKR